MNLYIIPMYSHITIYLATHIHNTHTHTYTITVTSELTWQNDNMNTDTITKLKHTPSFIHCTFLVFLQLFTFL